LLWPSEKGKKLGLLWYGVKLQKIVLSALVTALFSPFIVNEVAAQTPDFSLISSSDYFDSIGFYHIVGEIENSSNRVAQFVQVTATLYDDQGTVVGTPFTYTFIDVMRPGERSAFNIVFADSNQASRISSYTLNASATPANDKPRTLEVRVGDGYVDAVGFYHQVGEVVNHGEEVATFVEVSGAFYDSSGRVVDAGFGFTSPENIPPGGKAPFEIMLVGPSVAQIRSASVNADSQQYAAMPEFGVIAALVFAVSLVSVIGVARFKGLGPLRK
jgi:predicted secreted protein with PEFG-CTERM motif